MVQCPTRMKTQVFRTGTHDHDQDNDIAVVFKKVILDAMDKAIANSRKIGAKTLRAELMDTFGGTTTRTFPLKLRYVPVLPGQLPVLKVLPLTMQPDL